MLKISEEMVQKIVRYLGTKPYAEVAVLLSELQADIQKNATAEPVEPPKSVQDPKE